MTFFNLGILAHVDAGKTSLTERLLYTTGAIQRLGSVDAGTTQTDTLALEQQRGITIKSAVASFALGDLVVNLLDTPGHPDFIAEVERVLHVLDGAILVVSAVEGVQAQTRILMRALQRLRIPTLVFINKIDRRGAQHEALLTRMSERLTPDLVPLSEPIALGTRAADSRLLAWGSAVFRDALVERLSAQDDALLADYLRDPASLSSDRLRVSLAAQTRAARLYPVYVGSAITGAGIGDLLDGLRHWLAGDDGGQETQDRHQVLRQQPASGALFKIERGPAGAKIAYARLFTGVLNARDRLTLGPDRAGKVTALQVFGPGGAERADLACAGQIVKLWGLNEARIGDQFGIHASHAAQPSFAPPTLEASVEARRPSERGALHTALSQLTEQDPLIDLRRDPRDQRLFISLYGEVQKEVVQETLRQAYGLEVNFRESTVICIERLTGTGESFELKFHPPNPFAATIGLRVEPAAPGSGVTYQLEVELGSLPLSFHKAVEETVRTTLQQGIYGWQVPDCIVTMTRSGFDSVSSTAGDFRLLTPLVLMDALQQAGTLVHEPIQRVRVEAPADTLGGLLSALMRLRAEPGAPATHSALVELEALLPAANVHSLQLQLPGLTRGEGVLEVSFDHYAPVRGTTPRRSRTDNNPLSWKEYLVNTGRRS